MAIKNMDDLFLHTLKDIYYAENQITKALPKMAEKAGEPQLKQAMQHHLEQTKGQVQRLDKVFAMLNQKAAGETCPAIDGIIKEAEQIMAETDDPNTRDAAMISAAQAVEHYEITRYGTLISWADELGLSGASDLLQQTLVEEKETDAKLTELGDMRVNAKAVHL